MGEVVAQGIRGVSSDMADSVVVEPELSPEDLIGRELELQADEAETKLEEIKIRLKLKQPHQQISRAVGCSINTIARVSYAIQGSRHKCATCWRTWVTYPRGKAIKETVCSDCAAEKFEQARIRKYKKAKRLQELLGTREGPFWVS